MPARPSPAPVAPVGCNQITRVDNRPYNTVKNIVLFLTMAGLVSYGTSLISLAESPSPSSTPGGTPSSVTFEDVTVVDATTLSSKPKVTSESTHQAGKLKVKDLVVGTGE